MTDEQIIKALENMQYGGHSCADCKFGTMKGYERCGIKGCIISRQAALLINRQRAEIERLNGELVDRGLLPTITLYDYNTKQIRAEAITEYQEEVKKRCVKGGIHPAFVNRQMEDVRKEMVGE